MAWGPLRDFVIMHQQRYETEEFKFLYMVSLDINWPHGDTNILASEGGVIRVTDVFARHVAELSNWSLGSPFRERFPELKDLCKFKEYTPEDVKPQ